jgi:hypothetical protein
VTVGKVERMATTDLPVEQHDTRRPYPRLTEAQKARILADLLTEYRLNNLRLAGPPSE